jgi:DNA-binding LytR/AlgR family response regulator
MLKCLIIEDEPLASQLIESYIEKVNDLAFVKTFTSGIEALQFLQNNTIDLIFLDIQMPDLTGIQFMKIINGKYNVIFTTAYQEYALDGFEFDAIDYLLKPISFERFLVAIEKAKNKIVTKNDQSSIKYPDYIFVKTEYRLQRIHLEDILYLEALGDYVSIITKSKKILTLDSMNNFEKSLSDSIFIRVHRSFIISKNKIDFIERNRIVIGEKYIPIGSTYKTFFLKQLK